MKVVGFAVKAIRYELGLWASLFRWITRWPERLEPDARRFGYAGTATPLFAAFIVLSAVEIPIVDLVLPWRSLRGIALVAGAYGVLWMLGMLASIRVHPHVVDRNGLRVRNGVSLDLTIPWDLVASIRPVDRGLAKSRTVQLEHGEDGAVLHIVVAKQTNVDILFRHPTIVELPQGDTEPLAQLRIAVDDPRGFVTAARNAAAAVDQAGSITSSWRMA